MQWEVDALDGVTLIVCGRRMKKMACEDCGKPASIQCDYPVRREGKLVSCDRWQCPECAKKMAPNVHYCKGCQVKESL